MPDWKIPLSDLDYGPEETAAVQAVLERRWLSMGAEAKAFEGEFAAMQGATNALVASSATAALHLSLLALGIGPGDEVVQPALNFVAAANMTVAVGAEPVFADICSLDEPTVDPEHVERLIGPRTKAVIVMHYGGNLCRMDEIVDICKRRNIAIIEDACHAVGAAYRGSPRSTIDNKMAGSIGDISAFSFFANKNIAAGEGGMVVTNREDLVRRLRLLRSHGMTSLTWDRYAGHASSYDVVMNGYNYRLDELHAALGRVQLKKLARNNERRRRLLAEYKTIFHGMDGWIMPFSDTIDHSAGHLMVIVAPTANRREVVAQRLREGRIQTSLHYPCAADFEMFKSARASALRVTRSFVSRTITLPLYPALDRSEVHRIGDAVLGD
jgi:dTDP-4-amino-4,6-dideoxygalactose transaminase